MCHGHPKDHPCSHTSMAWYYCPSAQINLTTGYQTACKNITLAPAQRSKNDCPLKMCAFKTKGGFWQCCHCNNGPNERAWCGRQVVKKASGGKSILSTCDHGCCKNCTEYGKHDNDSGACEALLTCSDTEYESSAGAWQSGSDSVSDCGSWESTDNGLPASSPASSTSSLGSSQSGAASKSKKSSSRRK